MYYSFKTIIESFPKEKRKGDSFLIGRFFSRPLSFVFTYIFINIGISAWLTSILSAICALAGCILFAIDNIVCSWVGVSLILFWTILDCVDGNIARIANTQGPFGEFMDAESGYVICAFIYLSIGIKASYSTSLFSQSPFLPIIFGALASICDIYSRLIHQKFSNSQYKIKGEDSNYNINIQNAESPSLLTRVRKFLSVEIGVAGLVLLCMIMGLIFPFLLDYVVLFYFTFCGLSALLISSLLSIKARKK